MSVEAGLVSRPQIPRYAQVTVALMSAYTWLKDNEPGVLEWLSDPVVELMGDTTRAIEIAGELNAPCGVEVVYALDARGGIKLATFPDYVWEIVYPR